MPGKTLAVLGSDPGIGVAVACAFSVRGFTHIALVAGDEVQLGKDEDQVYDAIQERGYTCQIRTWTCDITDLDSLRSTLEEIESYGSLECVLFNAAGVAGKPPLEETIEHIEQDFRSTNLALYKTALWAIPILQKSPPENSPSLIVPSIALLNKAPSPSVSLSMCQAAQRSLVFSLHQHFGSEVHIALLSVAGVVAPDKKNLSPEDIAEKAWELYKQPRGKWEREMGISE